MHATRLKIWNADRAAMFGTKKIKEGNIIEKAFYAGKGSEPDAPSDSKWTQRSSIWTLPFCEERFPCFRAECQLMKAGVKKLPEQWELSGSKAWRLLADLILVHNYEQHTYSMSDTMIPRSRQKKVVWYFASPWRRSACLPGTGW